LAADPATLARMIVDQLTEQTVECLLESAFADDPAFAGKDPAELARHRLTRVGLTGHRGIVETSLKLGVPLIGLGASAPNYYRAVAERLGCRVVLPDHAGVANAIGAVVGQVSQKQAGTVTSAGEGRYTVHLAAGPQVFGERDAAMDALEAELLAEVTARARAAGAEDIHTSADRDIREIDVEGRAMFIEATISVTASGRPRVAHG
jgi:hypothetical protein